MTKTMMLLAVGLLASLIPNSSPGREEQTPAATLSPFGIGSCHSNNWGMEANARWIPQMVAIGITNHRTSNTGWSEVEPEEGKWRWEALDKQMAYLDAQHIAFGGIFAFLAPIMGPAAAGPAAAGEAAVMAAAGGIASAAGGWVVPSDQIAMVHQNEMILPAHIRLSTLSSHRRRASRSSCGNELWSQASALS